MTMANPSQKIRQRKVVYFVTILVLLFVSLLHRHRILEPMATDLKLREISKGEVELTSSAVRLSLTGSRGLAITFLWSAALRQQERHEWNELELVIGAITKLQPYFITPWLFQGWNLAYNVSVECDRPHDKFYYVSRGLHLLAEGERRNHEQSVDKNQPGIGQPDLRHFIGVAYQGKFGTSDEKITMRCLLDMACIDPLRRNPDDFWTVGPGGRKTVNLAELYRLCKDNPRLVRRLREHLGYSDPQQIVAFLTDNREVPSRFERPVGGPDQKETPLRRENDQFPILPPPMGEGGPNPKLLDLGLAQESMDVFVASRAWFQYAQLPVPPPSPDPVVEANWDRLKYRLPKAPSLPIYRGFPPRAQAYAAEVMEEEGWFDADGWLIRDWFAGHPQLGSEDVRVGTELKYQASPAWDRAFTAYKELGLKTGQYFAPGQMAELERSAAVYRKALALGAFEIGSMTLPAHLRNDERMVEGMKAHHRLAYYYSVSRITNFDGHFHQAEAERTMDQVLARKYFYHAVQQRASGDLDQALALFETGWPYWIGTCLRFPKYNEVSLNQEDAYELQLKNLRLMQKQHSVLFRSLALGAAELSLADLRLFKAAQLHAAMADKEARREVSPAVPLDEVLDPSDKSKILPIRNVSGHLDAARIYDVSGKEDLSRFLLAWSQAAGTPRLLLFPGQEDWTLATFEHRNRGLAHGWAQLFYDDNIRNVKVRYGLISVNPVMDSSDAPLPPRKQ
jgi:hypothetical protein